MNLLLGGYGGTATPSAALYDLTTKNFLWQTFERADTFLCSSDPFLFGITEETPLCALHLFVKDKNGFHRTDSCTIQGGLLCHLSFLPERALLFGACYDSGLVFSVKVTDERFSNLQYYQQGTPPPTPALTTTRAHCAVISLDHTTLYSANIALDRIYRYAITADGLENRGYWQLKAGVGPRHLLEHQGLLYIITEYSNEIITLKDGVTISTISTLPPDFTGTSFGSTLCLSPDKRFLYAANRGADSIARFALTQPLTPLDQTPCGGKYPRHIALSPDGTLLASTNQNDNTVTLLPCDPRTGALGAVVSTIPFDRPSFAQFL